MNHLAHLLLAGDGPEANVGQVLADFVTASDIAAFAPGIQAGIRAHQCIDSFADSHPVLARARRRLKPPYRRFGGVLLDIYFDHFLARFWVFYGDGGSLDEFADRTYRILNDYRDLPSARFLMVVAAMRRDNWLVGYASLAGVDRALRGLSKRFPHSHPEGRCCATNMPPWKQISRHSSRRWPGMLGRLLRQGESDAPPERPGSNWTEERRALALQS